MHCVRYYAVGMACRWHARRWEGWVGGGVDGFLRTSWGWSSGSASAPVPGRCVPDKDGVVELTDCKFKSPFGIEVKGEAALHVAKGLG